MTTVNVNGVELYCAWHGREDAPVLVLNNGVIMNATTSWVFQIPALAKHHRVLAYDCRGQGQSAHPDEPYTMEMHADDLAGLLDAFGVARADLVGISYGGEVAQAFALKYAQRVRGLVLADTTSEVGPELRSIVSNWIERARAGDAEGFFDATVPWNFSPEFVRAHGALMADARKRYAELDFPAVVRLCECFLGVDFTARLGEIGAPTCVVVGERDLLKGLAYAEILCRGIPQAELHVLRGAGHASCWERVAEFNTVVLGFLAKQAGGEARG